MKKILNLTYWLVILGIAILCGLIFFNVVDFGNLYGAFIHFFGGLSVIALLLILALFIKFSKSEKTKLVILIIGNTIGFLVIITITYLFTIGKGPY